MTDQELRLECLRLVEKNAGTLVSMTIEAELLFQYLCTGELVTNEQQEKPKHYIIDGV